jgi:hypothetical protein
MGTAGRKIGVGIAGAGMVFVAAGVFATGASGGEQGTERLVCESSSFTVLWPGPGFENTAAVSTAAGQSFSDGGITVTLSNAAPIAGHDLGILTIGELDFETSLPVDAVEVRLWQAQGEYDFDTVTYDPAVTSGHIESPEGSHPGLGQAPVKGLVFCYEKVPATTTTTTTTTIAVLPDQIVATTTVAPATVAPVEVLPQVVTAPEQIAFTGSTSGPLVMIGVVLVLLGLSLVGIDQLGLVRRGKHAR